MTCGIYAIINKETNQIYIGQSIDIERRFKEHIHQKDLSSYIDRSIGKYGKDAFEFKVLCKCDESELDLEERKFIALYNTYHKGYNLTRGGEISPAKHPEIAKKISNSHTGKKISHERKLKYSESSNSTGFFRVSKFPCEKCQNGFTWIYQWYEAGKKKSIYSVDLNELKKKVLNKGLDWIVINKEKAIATIEENSNNKYVVGASGVKYVTKDNCKSMASGYRWRYNDRKNNKCTSSKSLRLLKEKVLNNKWEWNIQDEDKYQQALISDLN